MTGFSAYYPSFDNRIPKNVRKKIRKEDPFYKSWKSKLWLNARFRPKKSPVISGDKPLPPLIVLRKDEEAGDPG